MRYPVITTWQLSAKPRVRSYLLAKVYGLLSGLLQAPTI
jgi:hypothetical protein